MKEPREAFDDAKSALESADDIVKWVAKLKKAAYDFYRAVSFAVPKCEGPHEAQGCYECHLYEESQRHIEEAGEELADALGMGSTLEKAEPRRSKFQLTAVGPPKLMGEPVFTPKDIEKIERARAECPQCCSTSNVLGARFTDGVEIYVCQGAGCGYSWTRRPSLAKKPKPKKPKKLKGSRISPFPPSPNDPTHLVRPKGAEVVLDWDEADETDLYEVEDEEEPGVCPRCHGTERELVDYGDGEVLCTGCPREEGEAELVGPGLMVMQPLPPLAAPEGLKCPKCKGEEGITYFPFPGRDEYHCDGGCGHVWTVGMFGALVPHEVCGECDEPEEADQEPKLGCPACGKLDIKGKFLPTCTTHECQLCGHQWITPRPAPPPLERRMREVSKILETKSQPTHELAVLISFIWGEEVAPPEEVLQMMWTAEIIDEALEWCRDYVKRVIDHKHTPPLVKPVPEHLDRFISQQKGNQ